MVVLSSSGEVGQFQDADQFQWASGRPLTQFACGFFAVGMALSMNEVGKPPKLTSQQVINDALAWYTQYNGNDSGSNTDGMSLQQEYSLLSQVKLHWQYTATDINVVKKWLEAGYPVLVAVEETSVLDMKLNSNPYTSWHPSGTHVILLTGIVNDIAVLARDSANCTNLFDPNSLRPGPRVYLASKLALVSATVVVPPWMPRPASSTPPVAMPPVAHPIVSKWVSQWQEQAASSEWMSTAYLFPGGHAPSYMTGIASAWQERYRHGDFDGPPLTEEYASHDWNGNPIIVQQFARKRYEWKDGKAEQY